MACSRVNFTFYTQYCIVSLLQNAAYCAWNEHVQGRGLMMGTSTPVRDFSSSNFDPDAGYSYWRIL